MFLAALARALFTIAGVYVAMGSVFALLGASAQATVFGLFAGGATITASTIQIVINTKEKTNGRYRKALEAHRAGAGGGAGNSAGTRTRRGAFGTGARVSGPVGTGGGMSGPFGISAAIHRDEVLNKLYAAAGITSPVVHVQQPKPAPRPAGEFDGHKADFAAGVVTGTRSFDVDKLGRLLGIAYAAVWTPGENEAKCLYRDDFRTLMYGGSEPSLRDAHKPPHSMTDCAHGFYGYYEGSNDYYEAGRVMGVVEGYGETIIGSRGFRAAKARIVALHIPADVSYGRRRLIARNYPGLPTFDSFDVMVAEFPPDDGGLGLNPETDPDFWTRKA